MTNKQMLSVERNWREALLSLEVVREALTSPDSVERLKNMDAGKLMVESILTLKELRALLDKSAKASGYCSDYQSCECMDKTRVDRESCDNWVSWGKPSPCAESQVKPAAKHQGEPVMPGSEEFSHMSTIELRGYHAGWHAACMQNRSAEQPAPVAMALPFAEKVIAKLQRFEACASDGQDVDIGRHWFDLLTQLELLRRVQRSPAYWEMTQQGEDALKATRLNSPQ